LSTDEPSTDLIYGLDERPPLREALLVALQHVLAVFVGIITPPLIVAGALKLGAVDSAYLVSMSLFVSGAATVLQTSRLGPVGSGLLSIQGTSFTFITPIISATGVAMKSGSSVTEALGLVFGSCLLGALFVMAASRCVRYTTSAITPIVTGTVVTLIGLTLLEVAAVNAGGGFAARGDGSFGSLQNIGLAALVIVVVLVLNNSRSHHLRMLSLVLGLAAGYCAGFVMGRINLAAAHGVPVLNLPMPFRFGISFDLSAFVPFAFLYLVTIMESIGDLTATSILTAQPITGARYFRRLQGGLLADGISSALGACLSSFPTTTFAQNNGVIQLTGVGSRYVGALCGGILIVLGTVPVIGVVIEALPPAALGGATLILFGMVAASGIRILSHVPMTRRNSVILAVSLGLGLAVTFVPDLFRELPPLLRNTFSSGIASGGICALVLNVLIPE
jgi:xanthine permease XanP